MLLPDETLLSFVIYEHTLAELSVSVSLLSFDRKIEIDFSMQRHKSFRANLVEM